MTSNPSTSAPQLFWLEAEPHLNPSINTAFRQADEMGQIQLEAINQLQDAMAAQERMLSSESGLILTELTFPLEPKDPTEFIRSLLDMRKQLNSSVPIIVRSGNLTHSILKFLREAGIDEADMFSKPSNMNGEVVKHVFDRLGIQQPT